MASYDIHLLLPEATEFELMPEPLQAQLNALSAKWPSFPGINTKSYNNKKLIHVNLQHPNLTKSVLDGLFAAFGLTWEVVGIRSHTKTAATYDSAGEVIQEAYYQVIHQIDKATVLPYIADISELGEGGILVTRAVTMADIVYLSMYAGITAIKLI